MKLEELVNCFRKSGSYELFCRSQSLNEYSEVIEVYMKKPFGLNNRLAFFEIEKTGGNIEYIHNEVRYFNLFDFYYFLDAIEELKNTENCFLTDIEVAKRLYNYAINDA